MGDFGVQVLPNNGTKIHFGMVIGKDSIASEKVKEQFAEYGLKVGESNAVGAQVTVGQDLISIGNQSKKGFKVVISPEVSAGFMTTANAVKIGEQPYWHVDVVETTRSWDRENDRWVYYESRYSRDFDNAQDAEYYARLRNGDDTYYRETIASYPQRYIRDINHKESVTRGTLKVGGAIELQKSFEDGAIRVGVVSGVDLLKDATTYVGGRFSGGWEIGSSTVGGFIQVDGDVNGRTKGDVRTSVGMSVQF